jgi:hypothetical protein
LTIGLENYAHALKSQISDEQQLGGKLDPADKKTLLDACGEILDWLSEFSSSACREDFEEQKEKLSQVAYSITSKLYRIKVQDTTSCDLALRSMSRVIVFGFRTVL